MLPRVLLINFESWFNKRSKELFYYIVEYLHNSLQVVCCLAFIYFKQKSVRQTSDLDIQAS